MNLIYFILYLILVVLITYLFLKRLGKLGCMSIGYIAILIFSITSLTFASWFFMYTSLKDIYLVSTTGKIYQASVVSYTEEERYDSDDNRYYTMYKPTVQFTTESGKVIEKTLDFSTSDLKIGDTYKINYNKSNDSVITLGFTLVMKLVGSFIFFFILTILSIGIVKYALGHNLEKFINFSSKAGVYFFIPFLMIGFNILLIYGIFYGNKVPWYITLLLIFFSVMLALGTWGYFIKVFSKDKPKLKRTSPNKWISNLKKFKNPTN
ncbi:DUF3592 domain-containing protein [Aureibaculum marinum]|uniref:DUF3592 domain-containing protein n=1 Tax=Aureibaculum marinum TaxID=2487930 RepID=A0A3N4P318_9FLAO|nr:DUF3592 domain-containing protein [Aureibaculum marinum]RPD98179.1 DUF3592 domain-containing protein [Aureibaculum marinum]